MKKIPSYDQGFAKTKGQSKFPVMWNKLEGVWCPCLGISGSNLFDWSGGRRHGTLTSFALSTAWALSSKGRFGTGYALDFDGANDHVVMTDTNAFDFERTDRFSISLWFKSEADPTTFEALASKQTTAGGRGYSLYINGSVASNPYEVHIQSGAGNRIVARFGTVVDQDWHHVALTYSGNSDVSGVKVYADGVEESGSTVENTLSTSISTTSNFQIGARHGTSFPYQGLEDDIRIYSRELTLNEVLNIRDEGPGALFQRKEIFSNVPIAPTTKNYYSGDFSSKQRLTRGLAGV